MSFDLQVNGYAGVDFNSDLLRPESLHHACSRLKADGVNGCLVTLITDDASLMAGKLRQLVALRDSSDLTREVIQGFHLEGPFINESIGFRGTHPQRHIRPASIDVTQRLLEAGEGMVRLVTLAPERDSGLKTTRFLAGNGVRVAAGHCDASFDELRAAIDAGLSLFTHLGNGCPLQFDRHDNIIQRALSLSDELWLCFIADGVHVPTFVLQNYLRFIDYKRLIIVTDAIAPAGLGPGKYTLGSLELEIGEDLVARAPDSAGGKYLAGSAGTMPKSIQMLQYNLGLSEAQIELVTNINPRRALGLSLP